MHVVVGVLIIVFSCFLLFNYVHSFLSETIVHLLSLGQISVAKSWTLEGPMIVLSLPSGTEFSAVMTWQRSGFLSIIIFGLLFVFLTFPLRGALWCKVIWLLFGSFVGLAWNLIRWALLLLAVYHMGTSTFKILDFLTGPILDFLWVVPVWSIGLSVLVSVGKGSKQTR
jgi:exosortase/archaeosortase family protein